MLVIFFFKIRPYKKTSNTYLTVNPPLTLNVKFQNYRSTGLKDVERCIFSYMN